jgi:hypothetical protein
MFLGLGRPGAEYSTFLKIIRDRRGDYETVTGDVESEPSLLDRTHPDRTMVFGTWRVFLSTSVKFNSMLAAYHPEQDSHFAFLSIREALSFE